MPQKKRYSEIDNITNFTFGYQKRNVTGQRGISGSTVTYSTCACIKYKLGVDCRNDIKLSRGDQIVKVTRRFLKVNNETWYRQERWRRRCFLSYIDYVGEKELQKYPFSEAIKQESRGPRDNPTKTAMGEIRYKEYQKFKSKLAVYQGRLKRYRANNNPTQRTLAGMANCESKIESFKKILEGYQCPQNQTTTLLSQTPDWNLQPPVPEKWKKVPQTWDPESLHPPKSLTISPK